jgi:pimeloyl-ACP methyl ester carboxylesterase
MTSRQEMRLADGRLLGFYDTGPGDGLALLWHHGSPQSGAPLDPLLDAAARRGIRLLTYARPNYGGSSALPGRDVASAAGDVAQLVDALGVYRFAVMGASGGGPHALACAALLPDRVTGAVSISGVAPYTTDFDWYAGMVAPGGLRAAAAGREVRARYAETEVFDENVFTAADWAALESTWASLGADASRAGGEWPDGMIDDDVAFAAPWGFDPGGIETPLLLVQGGEDRVIPPSHADSLLRRCPSAELWLRPRDGHVSILDACPLAMDWLLARAG